MGEDRAGRRISLRLTSGDLAKLDALAGEWGLSRSAAMRKLVDGASSGDLAPRDWPTRDELLWRLVEMARAGSVSAVQSLLARDEADLVDLAADGWDARLDALLRGDDDG